jgi:hypothetical protein
MPLFPEPRKALTGSDGSGMTLAVSPSTTHSSVVLGPIFSFFRTSDGTETCPRLVILVRISVNLQCSSHNCKPRNSLSCDCYSVLVSYNARLVLRQFAPPLCLTVEAPCARFKTFKVGGSAEDRISKL